VGSKLLALTEAETVWAELAEDVSETATKNTTLALLLALAITDSDTESVKFT